MKQVLSLSSAAISLAACLWLGHMPEVRAEAVRDGAQTATPISEGGADQVEAVHTWQIAGAFVYIGVLAGIAYFAVRYIRRRGSPGSLPFSSLVDGRDPVSLLSSKRLGVSTAVHLLEVGDRRLVVATHGSSVSLLELSRSDASP